MPRRAGVRKRDVLPDFIYNSKIVTKLINQVMLDGKKAIAEGKMDVATSESEELLALISERNSKCKRLK